MEWIRYLLGGEVELDVFYCIIDFQEPRKNTSSADSLQSYRMRKRVTNRRLRLRAFLFLECKAILGNGMSAAKAITALATAMCEGTKGVQDRCTAEVMMIISCLGNPAPASDLPVHLSIEERGSEGTLSYLQKAPLSRGGPARLALFFPFGFPCPRNRIADKMRYNVPSADAVAAVSLPKCGAANANI